MAWLLEEPKFHVFPKIKGLRKPADRVGDFTAKHFSVCDTLLYRYHETKEEIILRQLVASLYRIEDFNPQNFPKIANITDELTLKEAERIAFIFASVRRYITDAYPSIFKSPKESKETLQPVFRKQPAHTLFSKIIVMMAADELRLLGNLKESESTLIYDFLNALLESKKIHKMKANAQK